MGQRGGKIESISRIEVERLITDEKFELPFKNVPKIFALMLDWTVAHDILRNNMHARLEQCRTGDGRQKLHHDCGAVSDS